jgi:hypothetical protein
MRADLVALIARLNDIIARETVLLEALDLRQAAALVGDKLAALQALQAACKAARNESPADAGDDGVRRSADDDALRRSADDEALRRSADDEALRRSADDEALRRSVALLEQLSETNRAAIERGLALQMRLIETIATAVPRARAAQAPTYRYNGSQMPPRPPEAFAFVSRM